MLPTGAQALQMNPGLLLGHLRGAAKGLVLWAPQGCWAVLGEVSSFLGMAALPDAGRGASGAASGRGPARGFQEFLGNGHRVSGRPLQA